MCLRNLGRELTINMKQPCNVESMTLIQNVATIVVPGMTSAIKDAEVIVEYPKFLTSGIWPGAPKYNPPTQETLSKMPIMQQRSFIEKIHTDFTLRKMKYKK